METRLWDALDKLHKGRMIKGDRNDGQGGHCALGLIDAVMIDTGCYWLDRKDDDADHVALRYAVEAMFPERSDPALDTFNVGLDAGIFPNQAVIAAFNNHPDTSKDDLISVFEKAAIRRDEVL